jgi:hypothetical protein
MAARQELSMGSLLSHIANARLMMEELEALLKGELSDEASVPMAMANPNTMASAMCGVAHAICLVHAAHGQPSGKFINLFRDTQKLTKRISQDTNRMMGQMKIVPKDEPEPPGAA